MKSRPAISSATVAASRSRSRRICLRTLEPMRIDGISFNHVETDRVESYHYDGRTHFWEIFRHRAGDGRITQEWFAVRFDRQTHSPEMLNTAIADGMGGYLQKDRLYDVDATNPRRLLAALAGLIREKE